MKHDLKKRLPAILMAAAMLAGLTVNALALEGGAPEQFEKGMMYITSLQEIDPAWLADPSKLSELPFDVSIGGGTSGFDPAWLADIPLDNPGVAPAPYQGYAHDPRVNPSAMADVIWDPTAVYGFRPNPDSTRLGVYAEYDWSDREFVAEARKNREAYHENLKELYDLEAELTAGGEDIETVARAVSAFRNEIRLRAYGDDPAGLEAVKASNLAAYGNENGPSADSLFEKYGSWETVLEKAFSVNAGMDACVGLYDAYYDLYRTVGMIPDEYWVEALNWGYARYLPKVGTDGLCDPDAICTRMEAVTMLWRMAGCPIIRGEELPFTDVPETAADGGTDAVAWAFGAGITNGTGGGLFSPDAAISRGEWVTMLMRYDGAEAEGACEFTDVAEGAYYYDAVVWAVNAGVTNGTGADTFSPGAVCSNGQILTLLWRYAGE